MPQTIRAFIAVGLPDQTREKLNEIQKLIQAQAGVAARKAVRWVTSRNIHLTLKFLGEVSPTNLPSLSDFLQAEAARHSPFTLTIAGLGAFPNLRRPRVIWAGCETPADLANLQKSIDNGTHTMGYPSENRPFSAHLTLGRIAQNAAPDEVAQVSRALAEVQTGILSRITIDRFHLYQSDLRPGGAVYTCIKEFSLASGYMC